jgi:hypothetical protein
MMAGSFVADVRLEETAEVCAAADQQLWSLEGSKANQCQYL